MKCIIVIIIIMSLWGLSHAWLPRLPPPHTMLPSTLITSSFDILKMKGEVSTVVATDLLNNYYLFYVVRKNLYNVVLTQSYVFTEIQKSLREMTVEDMFIYGLFGITFAYLIRDISTQKSVEKLLKKGVVSKKNIRLLEMVLLVIMMVLFQDVDVATG